MSPGHPEQPRRPAEAVGRTTGQGPRRLCPARTADPPSLPATGRPLRRQPVGPRGRRACLRRRRRKKVEQANRPLRRGETRGRCVRLLGGLVLWVSALYCAPMPRRGKGRNEHGGGLYPELAVLGFHHGPSAALTSLVARQATLMPSFELATQELARRGLKLGIQAVHRGTHHLGEQLLIARRCDLQRYREGQMPAGTQLAGKRVCVQLDGGRIRLRKVTRKQKGKGKAKKQKRRYKGQWREPKLLTIFEIDAHGHMVRKSQARIDGTFRGPDEVMEVL